MSAAVSTLLDTQRPGVTELATLASLAARVDPTLLRALRVELAPTLDAGVEADLWFSPLTESRGIDGIVFSTSVVEDLRVRLARDPERLEFAWRVTDRVHRWSSPAIRLEERIAWLALSQGEQGAAAIESELRKALVALVREQRRGVARWVLRALPRMPRVARDTTAAWLLALRASHDTGQRIKIGEHPPAQLANIDVRSVLPGVADVEIGVLRRGTELLLGEIDGPGARGIRVPDTNPRYLDVQLADQTRHFVTVPAGGSARLAVPGGTMRIKTADHRVYELLDRAAIRTSVLYAGDGAKSIAERIATRLEAEGARYQVSIAAYGSRPDSFTERRVQDRRERTVSAQKLERRRLPDRRESAQEVLQMHLERSQLVVVVAGSETTWRLRGGRTLLSAVSESPSVSRILTVLLPGVSVPPSEHQFVRLSRDDLSWPLETSATLERIVGIVATIADQIPRERNSFTVASDGSGNYRSITEAIDHAAQGDTIDVKPGVYREQIQLKAGVTLRGADVEKTIIDGGKRGPVVRMANHAQIQSFTITNSGDRRGVDDAGVLIEGCTGCVVTGNRISKNRHYGVILRRCQAEVTNNVIERNAILGVYLDEQARFDIHHNVIANHPHSAVDINAADVQGRLWNNTIVDAESGINYGSKSPRPIAIEIYHNIFESTQMGINAPMNFAKSIDRNLFSQNKSPHWDWDQNRSVPLAYNGIIARAQLTSDWRLAPDSPAIGEGRDGEDLGAFAFVGERKQPLQNANAKPIPVKKTPKKVTKKKTVKKAVKKAAKKMALKKKAKK